MRIGRAQESYKRQPHLKIAIVGASGAGKTEWAARSPRPLIVLTEPQGLASIQTANPQAIVVVVESWEDFRKVFDAVKLAQPTEIDGQPASRVTIEGETFNFQTLVVDSFTDLQRLAINKLAGVESGTRDRLDFDSGAVNLSIEKWGQLTSGCEAVVVLYMLRGVERWRLAKTESISKSVRCMLWWRRRLHLTELHIQASIRHTRFQITLNPDCPLR